MMLTSKGDGKDHIHRPTRWDVPVIESAGELVRAVIQVPNGLQDALPCRRGDDRCVVAIENRRDGRARNPGSDGDVRSCWADADFVCLRRPVSAGPLDGVGMTRWWHSAGAVVKGWCFHQAFRAVTLPRRGGRRRASPVRAQGPFNPARAGPP